jgi:V8-like Glu-specific endopeptidase
MLENRMLARGALVVVTAVFLSGSAANASTIKPGPVASATTHAFSARQVTAAHGYWTRARMLAATPLGSKRAVVSASIPNPRHFNGVPTVGALFFTTGTKAHFCTASVVNSTGGDLALTAAHCVYGNKGYATNIAYVPKWHAGVSPYGVWPVASITVASPWITARNIDYDFAFLRLDRLNSQPIQSVTGGLALGINEGFAHPINVIGYNNVDNGPIVCASTSSKYTRFQMQFYCNDYQDGTSGGPWILGYNPARGTGIVFGDIGGYEQGGNYPYLSYSPYYSSGIKTLFKAAEKSDP